jgi:uncharacterized protein DUF2784
MVSRVRYSGAAPCSTLYRTIDERVHEEIDDILIAHADVAASDIVPNRVGGQSQCVIFRWLADIVVLVHAGFVVFVIVGAMFALRWPRVAWVHVPTAIWGALIEFGGWICPLTPLENALRERAGGAGYAGGFIEHYVLRTLYPAGLTAEGRWWLGGLVVTINLIAYAAIWRRHASRRSIS